MAEKRKIDGIQRRKAELVLRGGELRRRGGELWRQADRPLLRLEEGLGRFRRVHPVAIGAVGVGLVLLRRKLNPRSRISAPLISIGWKVLESVASGRRGWRQ